MITPSPPGGENFWKTGEEAGKRKKGRKEQKRGEKSLFCTLFNIGRYDRQKSLKKNGRNLKKFKGVERIFYEAILYTPA